MKDRTCESTDKDEDDVTARSPDAHRGLVSESSRLLLHRRRQVPQVPLQDVDEGLRQSVVGRDPRR